jgi:hypothetical protein
MMFACYRDPVISVVYGQVLRGDLATRENAVQEMAELLARVHAEQAARASA